MMADPSFQERMKQYTENDAFKQQMERTKEALQDKDKVKELEDTMKKRIEEGEKELEELKKKSAELEDEEKKKADELKVSTIFFFVEIEIYVYTIHMFHDIFSRDIFRWHSSSRDFTYRITHRIKKKMISFPGFFPVGHYYCILAPSQRSRRIRK